MDKIGRALLELSRTPNGHGDSEAPNGKRAWDDVCNLLVETNNAMSGPTLSDNPASQHAAYRGLMVKHGHRNMESIREIFQAAMASAVSRFVRRRGTSQVRFTILLGAAPYVCVNATQN
jgi:hypothetical protein